METPVKILHVEDIRSDAEIVRREMKKYAQPFEWLWVPGKKEFEQALREYRPNIILCDHSMPGFSSVEASTLIKKAGLDIPFILITATISEDVAALMMQHGISDYLLKDRLQRLPAAVTNALTKWQAEKQKQAYLEEIIANEARFRALIENNYDAITVRDKALKLIYRSPSANRMLGLTEHDTDTRSFYETLHPDELESMRAFIQRVLESPGLAFQFSTRIKHRDGNYLWVEGAMRNSLGDENIRGIICNFRDITERMESILQREKMTAQIVARNKELEQFAYIVSHNLRSPVANILGSANIIGYEGLDMDQKIEVIAAITSSARRLDEVINDLNVILQKKNVTESRQPVVLKELIESITVSIRSLIEQNGVTLLTDFRKAGEITTVKSYLYSIFYNLITNAIKYRQPDIPPSIKITSSIQDGRVRLTFKDNGQGIDLARQGSKVFGLYKRFHPEIEGKGMGLFMVKTQVETLGGSISVTSEVNKGTEFTIVL